MALTGYTREGRCIGGKVDAGTHHICLNLASTTGGNFCTVTGQSDWCSSTMACDDGDGADRGGSCPVEH